MKKLHTVIIAALIFLNLMDNNPMFAQSSPNRTWTEKEALEWLNAREWANGLNQKVFTGVNTVEFAKQYNRNKVSWDKAFAYLKETNLDSITPGKYAIDGDNVYAIVSEGKPKLLEEIKWEAHRKYIDIQYVILGKEKMGLASVSKAAAIDEFSESKDIGFYTIPDSDSKYYTAEPGTIFLFFPQDAHRPGIGAEGCDWDKKIVIKVKAD
jgi:biofilm protein TabA